jgi:transposase
MYIDTVPNRKSPPAILLREAWRIGKKTGKRTLANITHWPPEQIEALRRVLKGDTLVDPKEAFEIEQNLPHGHVAAVLGTIKQLQLDRIIASKRSRQRDLVVAMIAERLIHPCSKLATTRLWHTTTLAQQLAVEDADEGELYDALDWLLARQQPIEKRLAARHLSEGTVVLYDVTSSYYEGHCCPLACPGHDRDKQGGHSIIVYGVLTDEVGRPVAVEVYPGNTGDPTTVPDQVDKLRNRFGLSRVVLVGDRGMLTETRIEKLKEYPAVGWISALRATAVRQLANEGTLQMSLFDQRDLAEIRSAEFPGERLVACYNPLLAEQRRRKRQELLAATEKGLAAIAREVARRTKKPLQDGEIGQKVGRVINRFKMAKHFIVNIADGVFSYVRNEESILREGHLDGIYVIRTSEPAQRISAEDTVRAYKSLAHVERVFRTLKGVDLLVRPIYHRTDPHVRAHILLCMLAYYVEWHMRRALAPMLFDDEELPQQRNIRHPVKPAVASASAKSKKLLRRTPDGLEVHSFETLLAELGTRCRNLCRITSDPNAPTFYQLTKPTPIQAKAFELLGL